MAAEDPNEIRTLKYRFITNQIQLPMPRMKFILLVSIIGITITKISAQEITIFPGFFKTHYYVDDVKVNKAEINNLMQSHMLTEMYWKKSKRNMKIAWISLGVQYGSLIFQLASRFSSVNKLIPLMVTIGAGISAIGFTISASSYRKKAILTYNQLQSEEGLLLHFGQTHNGIGIVCSF